MLASKLNLPLPGGWKDKSGNESAGENYAAGVVGETGQVLDQAGKPVARITEGEADDLIGSVVAPSGEIINGSGEVVGQAAPLSEDEKKDLPTQPEEKKGGVDILGVAKSMKGAYDTLNKIPGAGNLAGQVSKGFGFGGGSGKDKEAEGQDEQSQASGDAEAAKPDTAQDDAPELDEAQPEQGSQIAEGGAPINMEDQSKADVDTETPKDTPLGDDQAEGDKKAGDEEQPAESQPAEEEKTGDAEQTAEGETAEEKAGEGEQGAEGEEAAEEEPPLDYSVLNGCKINKAGNVVNSDGTVVGRVSEGKPKDLMGRKPDENGDIWNDSGKVIGKAEPVPIEEPKDHAPFEDFPDAVVESNGTVITSDKGEVIGRVIEGDAKQMKGKSVDEDGDILDSSGNVIGKAERWEEEEPEPEPPVDYSVLKDCKVNKAGNVVNSDSNVVGRVSEGKVKDLIGRMPDENGEIWNDTGKVIGKAEPVPLEEAKEPAPFEDFPDATVETNGTVTFEGSVIGRVIEGDPKKLKGKTVDEDGDINDRAGNVIGKAERWEEEEPEPEKVDTSMLKDCKVNKAGNIINSAGNIVGRVSEGKLKDLVGRRPDENGDIWDDSGNVIGKGEPVPLEEAKEPAPFEDFSDAVVESDGTVTFEGNVIGRVIEGDAKKLKGKKVDEDGDILDRAGNAIGKAERWEEEIPEPEEIDMSILAGKRVNKLGNVVDSSGTIYGRLVDGDPKRLAGRMCDKDGNVRSESGDVIGRVELVSEGEREGMKDGPFAELPGCTVAKDGKVVTSSGDVVGRLVEGDGKVLFGRAVDEDGDVLDRNGNKIGRAERWAEEEKPQNPMCGRKVNREGNVVDADGNIIGKLTSGELSICSGKEIDNDGDVVDGKGTTVGHVSLLEDIPDEEPEETAEEREKRLQAEEDKKLAQRMAMCVEQCLDKIRPICSMITDKIDKADRTPKEELDEEQLVKDVKPLIEEGHKILQEANGVIRGLDPDGHIQANAKHKTASREATPEEYHLADVLKELTGTVTETIESAKRKIQDMPHAKKELNPLWALLTEPLGQIIAAVGLLLNGVLELVGRLLNGLGLGGLVNNLLGGLGLTSVLKGLGIGGVVDSLTGQKGKK